MTWYSRRRNLVWGFDGEGADGFGGDRLYSPGGLISKDGPPRLWVTYCLSLCDLALLTVQIIDNVNEWLQYLTNGWQL
jgi:hypothetical protein